MRYLLDLRVRSGRRTDFTARTRRLVDESAGRTGPLCLQRKNIYSSIMAELADIIRLLVRENLLQHMNLNVTCDQQQWEIHPNSLHINELTYLRFTSLVAVIVQVEILHVGEIFDITLSFASSPYATWSWQTENICCRTYSYSTFFFLSILCSLWYFIRHQKKSTTILFTVSVVKDATKCLHMVNAPWLLWFSLEGKVL